MGVMSSMLTNEKPMPVQMPTIQAVPRGVTPPGCPALPCPGCRSPLFWFSRYDQERRLPKCCDCDPAPSAAFVRLPLFGIAGSPGGPWWWETLADSPEDRIVFGRPSGDCTLSDAGNENCAGSAGQAEPQLIEHTHHGHQLLTVVGSDSVAWSKDTWTKCLVFCWPDRSEEGKV